MKGTLPVQRPLSNKRYSKQKPYVFWTRAAFVLVVLFPLSLTKIDFRGSFVRGLSVSAHKSSPAYAAFEDLTENYDTTEIRFPEKADKLTTGEKFDFQEALRQGTTIRQVALQGVTIRGPLDVTPKPYYVAGESSHTTPTKSVQKVPVENQLYDIGGRLLPIQQRKNALLSAFQNEDLPAPADGAPDGMSIRLASGEPQPLADRPFWLSGQVEMTEGLAFVGPQTQISVKRVYNGNAQELGRLWVTEGRFEIHVKEPRGYLVAELKSSSGRVLGQGEISLIDVVKQPPQNNRIAGLRIALRPTPDGAAFHASSGYSYDQHSVAVNDAKVEIQSYGDSQAVDDEGFFNDHSLTEDSSFVARATAKDQWPTIVLGHSRRLQEIRLFSKKMLTALIGLTASGSEIKEAEKMAIIWGRVTRQGVPVVGAKIEMAGEFKPIYFGDYKGISVPDAKLTVTSKNGLFSFIRVPEGVQALRISLDDGNTWIPSQIFPTENKHVSYLDLELKDRVLTQLNVFDGFDSKKPVQARVHVVGVEDRLQVGQNDFVEFSVAANPYFVEAEPDLEYFVSRVTVAGSPHRVNIPLVSRQWMNTVMSQNSVTQMADRGVVVGFFDDPVNAVELTGYGPQENMQIYYFDAGGNIRDSQSPATAGGGFVIFNVPLGLQTLYVQPTTGQATFAQIVVPEPDVLQVVTH
jgi:hypothetical protein